MTVTELIDLVRDHIQFWFHSDWWHPVERCRHVTFYFESDEQELDFTFLKDGIFRIVDNGIDMGTWPQKYLSNHLTRRIE